MNVQTLTSDNLFEWSQGSDALPKLASWSTPGKVWAPEAVKLGLKWVMYYTTRAPNPEIQCIGVAVGDAPVGPYRDSTRAPLVCEADQGGSIDASPFVDQDGAAYLYWKNDGNAVDLLGQCRLAVCSVVLVQNTLADSLVQLAAGSQPEQ